MIAHVYLYGDPNEMRVETSKVTLLEHGRQFGYPEERILVLGVVPRVRIMPMSQLEWFWIEDE